MKPDWTHLEAHRITAPDNPHSSNEGEHFGQFIIKLTHFTALCIIATEGDPEGDSDCGAAGEWEHVSVHAREGKRFSAPRTPTWAEMCFTKELFWEDDEAVVQYHPPKVSYVNQHPHVLHLWRHRTTPIPLPPTVCV